MRSEAHEWPIMRQELSRLPGGRWIDPRVLDDAIGQIAVADLMAARHRARRNEIDRDIAKAEQAGAQARAALMALVEEAIAPKGCERR